MMKYGRIAGWGKCVPHRVVTNAELEKTVDTSDEWIVTRTGIRERHIAGEGETTASLSVGAAWQALDRAGIRASDLDLIIVATSSPDYLLPPVSSMIQDQLGASCGAFMVTAGCTGFVYALATAQQFIAGGAYKNILVIGAETMKSTLFTARVNPDEQPSVEFNGRGSGHGVGMSQWGARGQALLGRSYLDILRFYYTGVSVETR